MKLADGGDEAGVGRPLALQAGQGVIVALDGLEQGVDVGMFLLQRLVEAVVADQLEQMVPLGGGHGTEVFEGFAAVAEGAGEEGEAATMCFEPRQRFLAAVEGLEQPLRRRVVPGDLRVTHGCVSR